MDQTSSTVGAELEKRRRHMPHWQMGGSTYFVTFRSARGDLPHAALAQIVENIRLDDGRRYDLRFAVVMRDHVHLLIRPLQEAPGHWHRLEQILKSLKGVSSRRINQLLGTSAVVWQAEYFDRIVRDQAEYAEKLNYMWNNPGKRGLVAQPEDWPFFVFPREDTRQ